MPQSPIIEPSPKVQSLRARSEVALRLGVEHDSKIIEQAFARSGKPLLEAVKGALK
jgi:hypothetical protein